MLTSLLWRARWPADATRTYYAITGFSSLFWVLNSTLSLVYMATTVGLSPLQMVLVGTVLEAVTFLFEIPTGIVSDLYSRRLSVIIGYLLMGAGFLLQGLVPTFEAVLLAQVIWGIGFTFTSGAEEAWLTDEIGQDNVAQVFTRGQQVYLGTTLVGTLAAGALGLIDIRVPLVASGAGFMVLAVGLLLVMPEQNFTRVPRDERETFRHMGRTLADGIALARRRPVVRSFLLVSLFVGLSSEAFDRLWTVRVLEDFDFPDFLGTDNPVVWFTAFSVIGTCIALGASLVVNKVSPASVNALHPRGMLALLAALQVLGVAGLAVLGNLWLALAAMWLRDAAVALSMPVQAAWLNRNVDSRVRATTLSMNSQANAIGQVAGGPPLGGLANRTSVSTALVTSAVVLAPIVAIYARLKPPAEPK
ncbi:MFS transporter [Actinopolymorpha pittospori]|uniref:DHA3 family tetracycline resistance protein-like MFS transporter n=1 Tax=Actinopolymorpha pittospori TaxID=648752 RepID=A0A927NCZ0_9ACTN|nr:DHA3 family tetracycline resistance protein-like MFS transporter [Actinopolymorpha pittospori]